MAKARNGAALLVDGDQRRVDLARSQRVGQRTHRFDRSAGVVEENVGTEDRHGRVEFGSANAGDDDAARQLVEVAHAIAVPVVGSKRRIASPGSSSATRSPAKCRRAHRHANDDVPARRLNVEIRVGTGRFAPRDAAAQRRIGNDAHALGTNAQRHAVARQEIHRTFSQEARDGEIGRRVVNALRLAGILEPAIHEHGQLTPHAHRFDVIVGDVKNRARKMLAHAEHFVADRTAQRRVEMRQRLVEQQRRRIGE